MDCRVKPGNDDKEDRWDTEVMFTGIVNDIGEVMKVEPRGENLRRLTIACGFDRSSITIGASIACAGICLTVVETGGEGGRTSFAIEAAAETMAMTNVGRWQPSKRVNLERSLKLGDELGGHLVTGHIDGVAEIIAREDLPDMARLALRAPASLVRFIAPKGSVALDGVSMTVNAVEKDTFSVLIIPHTLAVTTFGAGKKGDALNLEVDLMARYAARLIEAR
jgi:riboflavin synthase